MIFDHISGSLSQLDAKMVRAIPEGGNWRDLPENIESARVQQIRRSASLGKGSRSTYYGRLRWERPSYTISTYFNRPGNGCFMHPQADRLITLREAARLQSFPDGYRFYGNGRSRFVQIGNAVPPLLAYHLGKSMLRGTAVDLFSGAGGMSLGLEWAGFDILAAVDNDATCLKTFQENRQNKSLTISADLSNPSGLQTAINKIRERSTTGERIALISGGPPCQGISTAGHCRLDDPRNKLLFSFLKAVSKLNPIQVLMENVASLTFKGRRSILDELLYELRSMNYHTSYIIAHAEGYGVPQLRRRLFLLATEHPQPAWPLPFRQILDPMMRKFQPLNEDCSYTQPVTVREAIGDLPLHTANSPDDPIEYRFEATSDFQKWSRGLIGTEFINTTFG